MISTPSKREPVQLTDNGAWCWFQDPRAVYLHGRRQRTYLQWMTRNGALIVAAYDHQTGELEQHLLKADWDQDDHNVGSLLVLPDKRLMVFYARHCKPGLFCRTALKPEAIDEWGAEITVCSDDRLTYSHPVYLSAEENIYLFWRGQTWKPTMSTSVDGHIWSEPCVVIEDDGRTAQNIRPYVKVTSNGVDTIHIAFTDGHPAVEPSNSLYYLALRHNTFYRADGSRIGDLSQLPIAHSRCDKLYDGATMGRAWVWDIALDEAGNPAIAYTRLPAPADHRYHLVEWHSGGWRDTALTKGGGWFPQTPAGEDERELYYSGGIALDQANPNRLFLSRPIDGQFEIEMWHRQDKAAQWQTQPITRNSGVLNVRPLVPRGYRATAPYVAWMHGRYTHYTDYSTGISMLCES